MVTVTTKDELKNAKNAGSAEIVVGDLADKLNRVKKIAALSTATVAAVIAMLGVATVAAPETMGLSYVAAFAPVAALTGMEIAAIVVAVSLGFALIVAVFKDYEEVSY